MIHLVTNFVFEFFMMITFKVINKYNKKEIHCYLYVMFENTNLL